MGNVSADGKMLWLSGRFDDVVYAFDTTTGAVRSIRSARNRTGWPSGRSPGVIRLVTPGIMR